ncbi:MAG: LytS/YhcK type 5TM receptor domain-containing protein [Alkaliphilus sp.]
MFVVAFLLTRLQVFKRLVVKKDISFKDKVILSVLFGCFGIMGTYLSVRTRTKKENQDSKQKKY